ncbi:hypothetical protein [Sphingomonas humi]|uniref:PepSY domain-containing protein n=1 Tax=Sphingomonas humi TaxID=335630 RepID=A0ABP7S6I2_9SPHN
MKKLITIAALAALCGTLPVIAHPTNVAYASRGECEAAAAESAKRDRERLVALGIFKTIGAAQSTFHDDWQCEYDRDDDAWYIVDHRGD